MTSDARSAIANGIWLCQDHAKLVDDDELRFPASMLREWKETAEHMAALEARGYAVRRVSLFPELERKLPKLIEEMRVDLIGNPLTREFIIMSKHWTYNAGRTPLFRYLLEDHDQLLSAMTIMVHYGAIYGIKYNNVDRYNFTENFVSYLVDDNA